MIISCCFETAPWAFNTCFFWREKLRTPTISLWMQLGYNSLTESLTNHLLTSCEFTTAHKHLFRGHNGTILPDLWLWCLAMVHQVFGSTKVLNFDLCSGLQLPSFPPAAPSIQRRTEASTAPRCDPQIRARWAPSDRHLGLEKAPGWAWIPWMGRILPLSGEHLCRHALISPRIPAESTMPPESEIGVWALPGKNLKPVRFPLVLVDL